MFKSYLLMGSLVLSGMIMVGGSSYYGKLDNEQSHMRLAEIALGDGRLSEKTSEPVPIPLWVMQKIFSTKSLEGTPVPCPIWMLYNIGKSAVPVTPAVKSKI